MKDCKYLFSLSCRGINIKIFECPIEYEGGILLRYRYTFECALAEQEWEDEASYNTPAAASHAAVLKAEGSWAAIKHYWETEPGIVHEVESVDDPPQLDRWIKDYPAFREYSD